MSDIIERLTRWDGCMQCAEMAKDAVEAASVIKDLSHVLREIALVIEQAPDGELAELPKDVARLVMKMARTVPPGSSNRKP